MNGKQAFWKDRRIEELTRDELIEACYKLHEMLEVERRWHREEGEMRREFQAAYKAITGR